MGRNLLILMAAMGLFSAMFSSMPQRSMPENGIKLQLTEDDAASSDTPSRNQEPANSDGVTLERESDGHFYADVEVNGTLVHMLVDTGASGIALSREDARSAGIATSIGMNDIVGEGADGAVRGEVIRIDRLRLGETSAEGLDAVVLNSGGMSLLGQDFLRQFQSVRIEDDRMILR
jgi:aspartyl protease family protein